jgi:eukaryotic-like serine/threonine-protein kinase
MEVPPQIGRFRVLDLVGEGAMGVVFRGRDESLDRDVALKVMRAGSADAEDKERFLREARAVARLQHPNIVTIYELGEHEGSPFIAMELLEGIDLQRAIEGGLRPNPRATLPIVLQLLAGLGHAHDHAIVHRDVKPSNLFLPRGRPAKIMDFGVARLGGTTSTGGLLVGTPNYMSPEQVKARPVDGRSDLFSAALILYELVTGEKAYQGDSVVALVYKIAHEDPELDLIPRGPQWDRLRDVLVRGLAKDPDERYATAAAMAADLALALQDLGGSIDGAAASDKGVVKRTSYTAAGPARTTSAGAAGGGDAGMRTAATAAAPRGLAAARPVTPPPATGPSAPVAVVAARPRWMVPAVIGVIALVATAAALVALLVWPPGGGGPGPEPSATGESGDSLVSSAASLASPSPPAPRQDVGLHGGPQQGGGLSPPAPESPAPRPSASPPVVASPRVVASALVPQPVAEPPEAASPRAAEPVPASGRLERANELYEKGRYAAALAEAKAVLRREPGNREAKSLAEDIEADMVVETRLKQARDAMRRGDRDEALVQVRAGLAVKSTDGRLLSLFKELTQ